MSANPPERYEASFYLKSANLELTSTCNLRCTYCAVSQPHYSGTTMSGETRAAALEGLRRMKAGSVALNGHGETTTLDGWTGIASTIRKAGARVHLTSNFARVFTPDEIDALAAMASIVVSLDTDDAELLRRIRRSVNLETVLENVRRVRETAARKGIRCPVITASCVVHTHNVMHLDRFVRFCLRNGIRGFGFCNLVEYADLPGALNVDHVTTLPREQLVAARRTILEARGIAFSKGATCEIQSGLLDSIDRALAGGSEGAQAALGHQRRRFAAPGDGETRRCLDPWQFALIRADGSVGPCCWLPPVGSLSEAPLEAILNGDAMVALRRQLLTGDLGAHCRTCPARPVIPVAEFRAVVRRQVPAGLFAATLLRLGLSAKRALDPAGRLSRRLLKVAG